jgi:CRISPR-associated protein Csb2
MGTTLAVRFPLGRYHANPWGQAVNEGATEWPPSPWRVLRALIATWHTRWPDLPVPVFDALLDQLGDPLSYAVPGTTSGHTRHYLPDLGHRKGETGRTDLTLDPFRVVDPDAELLIHWDVDLSPDQRQVLAKLAELLPYLGRAEAVCEAQLMDTEPEPGLAWWRPDAPDGTGGMRLLAPVRPIDRAVLEMTTSQVRKRRRTMPPGTRWVTYTATAGTGREERQTAAAQSGPGTGQASPVTAIRYAVTGPVGLRWTRGVLLADELHRQVGLVLKRAEIPDQERAEFLGSRGATTDHRHAHWIPLAGPEEKPQFVTAMLVWVPREIPAEALAAVISLPKMSGWRGGYEVRGFPEVRLLFQAAGTVEQVAPELCKPARHWRSRTPYLPVRHRKREQLEEFLVADVAAELRYRELPAAAVTQVSPDEGFPDRWARDFRRYRLTETMAKSRPGLGLHLEFADPVAGPLFLGQLSHFGYGMFEPDEP